MKIIIAGAGAVGTHLAKLLSKEDQDIVLIDEDPKKTEALVAAGNNDLLTLNLPPTNIRGLKEAGVSQADLFIAVTPDETRNITCAMLAKKIGAKKTVARVDNEEYIDPINEQYFKQMGIDSIIYPEKLATEEILNGLKRSWVRQYWEMHDGALVMLGVKLRKKTAKILDTPLRELCPPDSPYHIVAIKRGQNTLIPNGYTELLDEDIAYFMTTKRNIDFIRHLVGKEDYPEVHNVMVMGGGRIAQQLAASKLDSMHMKIIERSAERCRELSSILDEDIMVINGDARDSSLLVEEGIRRHQAFVALTDSSETNILACLSAKHLGIRKTVALVENMDYVQMAEDFDIGTIINKKSIAASRIYKMMLGSEVDNVRSLAISKAEVAEFTAVEGSPVTQRLIKDMKLPDDVNFGGLVRNGEGMPISGNTQIKAGDIIVVFCKGSGIKKIDTFFRAPKPGLLSRILN